MAKIKRDTLLGVVFFTGLGVLLLASLNLMDFLSYKHAPLVVRFPDAAGIAVGDPVLVLGKRIGKVESVEYDLSDPSNPIALELRLQQEILLNKGSEPGSERNPRRRASIQIQDATMLGGKQVWIDPMPEVVDPSAPDDLVPWTDRLLGTTTDDLFEAVSKTFSEDSELDLLLQSARRFFDSLGSNDNSVGLLLTRDEFYQELLATVKSLRTTVDDVKEAQGFLGRLVYDRTMADDLSQTADSLRRITDKMANSVRGPLPRLINDETMSVQLAGIVDDVAAVTADLREGRGPLGQLVQNEEMARNLDDAVMQLADLLTKANDPEAGVIGGLLGDRRMREDVSNILANLSETTDNLNSPRGLLGKLITDEAFAAKFERLVDQFSRAVEDAREAAPIGTFFQVLAAPF